MIRILVTHDEPLVRMGLRALLDAAAGLKVVAEACDYGQALAAASTTSPDVILAGLRIPHVDTPATLRRLRALPAQPAVIVLTPSDSPNGVVAALDAGAAGYLLRNTPPDQVIHAVHTVAHGGTVLTPACAAILVDAARSGTAERRVLPEQRHLLDTLPEQLKEVLRHVGEGRSNAQIARRMYLTEGSVKGYVSRILATLRISNRTQAAILAHRAGLLHRDAEDHHTSNPM